ncbi:hypothetical protein ACJX0J_002901, partial [Zea mays]
WGIAIASSAAAAQAANVLLVKKAIKKIAVKENGGDNEALGPEDPTAIKDSGLFIWAVYLGPEDPQKGDIWAVYQNCAFLHDLDTAAISKELLQGITEAIVVELVVVAVLSQVN